MTAKKLVKYVDYLQDSKAKIEQEYASVGKIAQKQLELKITEEEVALAQANNKIREAKSSYPFNADAIVEAIDDVDILERRIEQLKIIAEELF
jgi:hypothetical protein